MAIYLNDTPPYGWSKKGTDCIIKTKNSLNKKRYTIGMNIDIYLNLNISFIKCKNHLIFLSITINDIILKWTDYIY